MDFVQAATSLIKKLNAPPQAHSVYIKHEVPRNPDGTFSNGFTHKLCISIRPEWKSKISIPKKHLGFDVEIVEWPQDSL